MRQVRPEGKRVVKYRSARVVRGTPPEENRKGLERAGMSPRLAAAIFAASAGISSEPGKNVLRKLRASRRYRLEYAAE